MNGWVILLIMVALTLFSVGPQALAKDRCADYVPEVRIAATKYLGITYPYHYNIGSLKQESACRGNITAFDGGQGIAQFMPSTARWLCELGHCFNPYNINQAINAHAYYISVLHKSNAYGGLWMTFQAYNGGWKTLIREYSAAGCADWNKMRQECRRKVLTLKGGGRLDLCDVNYDYSRNVFAFGSKFRTLPDGMRYW